MQKHFERRTEKPLLHCNCDREVNSPIVNAAGKFLMRLLYLETCRKTTVDEYLPADGKCRLSLPFVMKCNEQRLTFLTKALLKKKQH
jgi:hypothetical protein